MAETRLWQRGLWEPWGRRDPDTVKTESGRSLYFAERPKYSLVEPVSSVAMMIEEMMKGG